MMKNNDNNAELPLFKNNIDAEAIICDYAIYADGANIEFTKPYEIPAKRRTFCNNINNLKVQWGI